MSYEDTVELEISQIEESCSRYRLPSGAPPSGSATRPAPVVTTATVSDSAVNPDQLLQRSIAARGIVAPLIVHDWQDRYHLVDGFKRISCARHLGLKKIPCRVLPSETDVASILELVLHERHDTVATAAGAARFLSMAEALGVAAERIEKDFLPPAGFRAHGKLRKQLLRVARLPPTVLSFCEEKRFSLKQCSHLTRHPRELLHTLFAHQERLALSAAVAEELLDRMSEIMRIENIGLEQLFEDLHLDEIIAAGGSNAQRTATLRTVLRQRRFPRLCEIEARMSKALSAMPLPDCVSLSWDPSLERREVLVHIRISEARQWLDAVEQLSNDEIAEGIDRLLEDL